MKNLILIKFLTFKNFDLNLNYLFKFCIKSSIHGLSCEQMTILIMVKEKNYIAYKKMQNTPFEIST